MLAFMRTPEDDLIDQLSKRLSTITINTFSDVRPLVHDFVMAGGDSEKLGQIEAAAKRTGHSPTHLMRIVVESRLLSRQPIPKLDLSSLLSPKNPA